MEHNTRPRAAAHQIRPNRITRASDSAQRRHLLNALECVISEVGTGTLVDDVLENISGTAEPDLIDFWVFVSGAAFEQQRAAPRLRAYELRCMPYREYLKTEEWTAKREEQLDRDGWRCRLCNSDTGLHVHHRTYENRGNEQPGELVTLCSDCHRVFHANSQLVKT